MTTRLCSVCGVEELSPRNQTGICSNPARKECQKARRALKRRTAEPAETPMTAEPIAVAEPTDQPVDHLQQDAVADQPVETTPQAETTAEPAEQSESFNSVSQTELESRDEPAETPSVEEDASAPDARQMFLNLSLNSKIDATKTLTKRLGENPCFTEEDVEALRNEPVHDSESVAQVVRAFASIMLTRESAIQETTWIAETLNAAHEQSNPAQADRVVETTPQAETTAEPAEQLQPFKPARQVEPESRDKPAETTYRAPTRSAEAANPARSYAQFQKEKSMSDGTGTDNTRSDRQQEIDNLLAQITGFASVQDHDGNPRANVYFTSDTSVQLQETLHVVADANLGDFSNLDVVVYQAMEIAITQYSLDLTGAPPLISLMPHKEVEWRIAPGRMPDFAVVRGALLTGNYDRDFGIGVKTRRIVGFADLADPRDEGKYQNLWKPESDQRLTSRFKDHVLQEAPWIRFGPSEGVITVEMKVHASLNTMQRLLGRDALMMKPLPGSRSRQGRRQGGGSRYYSGDRDRDYHGRGSRERDYDRDRDRERDYDDSREERRF